MNEDSWEQRMAQRAAEDRFREGQAAYEASDGKVYRSADEVWAAWPDACRDCDEPCEMPGTYYGWTMRGWVCGGPPSGCPHVHQLGEVPIG